MCSVMSLTASVLHNIFECFWVWGGLKTEREDLQNNLFTPIKRQMVTVKKLWRSARLLHVSHSD